MLMMPLKSTLSRFDGPYIALPRIRGSLISKSADAKDKATNRRQEMMYIAIHTHPSFANVSRPSAVTGTASKELRRYDFLEACYEYEGCEGA